VYERIQQVANGFQLEWMKICVVFDGFSCFLNKVDGWWTLRAWEIYSNSLKCPTIWKNLVRFFYLDSDREYAWDDLRIHMQWCRRFNLLLWVVMKSQLSKLVKGACVCGNGCKHNPQSY